MLPPSAAFTMLRPMLEYLDIFPNESVKVDIETNWALFGAPSGLDGTVASENTAATLNGREEASVPLTFLPPVFTDVDAHGTG
jgi:hypothetical protein